MDSQLFDEAYQAPNGEEEVTVLFHYLVRVAAKEDKEVMVDRLKSVMGQQRTEELMGTLAEELIGTLAEKYFEKGRDEGLAKGLAKGLAEGRAKGLAKARAEDVLRILAVRGVGVNSKARQRILSCADLDTLGRWLDRAVTATRISQVLEDPPQ